MADASAAGAIAAVEGDSAWSPGISSHIPKELRHLTTLFRPENSCTSVHAATELQSITGLPLSELVEFLPERLVLHELLIRVMADLSVPDGSRIGDLGINFREMTRRLLDRHIAPEMPRISDEFQAIRARLERQISDGWSDVMSEDSAPAHEARWRVWLFRRTAPSPKQATTTWGPKQITEFETRSLTDDPLAKAAYRALARVTSALFSTHGHAWGTPELICSTALALASNRYGSNAIGQLLEPILRKGAVAEGYCVLPRQEHPVVINTKGASASGKSSLRPLQKQLAGSIGVRWGDFALISPDIWRKQLLDYSALGAAYKYAGPFSSEELQIIDYKLDDYMALKHERGEITHLLIDRFRFDSQAPDSDVAGSNLLTRFGESVYLFFVITPPQQLVERAWKRGLEFGRFKAVDDTLAHCIEAYAGMPRLFFTWIRRSDKKVRFELLDNSVAVGHLPRTVAFGSNACLNVLDIGKLLDIDRFCRVDVDASGPEALFRDPLQQQARNNTGFLSRCLGEFDEVNFAHQGSGHVYLRVQAGAVVSVDPEALSVALRDPDAEAALRSVLPEAVSWQGSRMTGPHDLQKGSGVTVTLGNWGNSPASAEDQSRKSP